MLWNRQKSKQKSRQKRWNKMASRLLGKQMNRLADEKTCRQADRLSTRLGTRLDNRPSGQICRLRSKLANSRTDMQDLQGKQTGRLLSSSRSRQMRTF